MAVSKKPVHLASAMRPSSGLDVFLERDRDRELFDLAPNKENADGNPD